jgi:hypothetical protein
VAEQLALHAGRLVVEINGVYYLCNASYPDVNLMLNVTL